jgi:cation:H+ antiporter
MDLLTLLLFACGFVALIGGAECMVRGASSLALAVGISPLVVGLTVVAFGTSAPELGVSVMSAYSGQAGIAIGNVVGSNICNVLLILGLSALAAPLVVCRQLLLIEGPLVLGVSLLAWALALDGAVGRLDGTMLFSIVLVYTVWAIRRSRRQNCGESSSVAKASTGDGTARSHFAGNLLLILVGLALLGVGANWLVSGAVALAKHFGVSDLLIGLTIVSIGTSLPELATSVMASLRGQRDMAVGNIVGSNLFNILAVLGLTAVVAPGGVPVAEQALGFDIPVMVAVMAVCLPVFFTGYLVSRWEGALLTGYYIIYTLYLTLSTVGHPTLPVLNGGLVWVALPLTALLLAIATGRSLHGRVANVYES